MSGYPESRQCCYACRVVTEKTEPTVEGLVRRLEALEDALDQMLGAFKADLAALRDDLRRLDADAVRGAPPQAAPRRDSQGSMRRQTPPPRRRLSEEMALDVKKKDPRADD